LERTNLWGYANLWMIAEVYSESLDRKKLEQYTAKTMDERIGQTVRQYTQQAAAAIPFKTGTALRGVSAAPATNTSRRIAKPQQCVQDAGWPQRR
jgi:hypothetical protein